MAEIETGWRYRVAFLPFPGLYQVIDERTGEVVATYRTLAEARAHPVDDGSAATAEATR